MVRTQTVYNPEYMSLAVTKIFIQVENNRMELESVRVSRPTLLRIPHIKKKGRILFFDDNNRRIFAAAVGLSSVAIVSLGVSNRSAKFLDRSSQILKFPSANMPRVKSVKSLTKMCINFIVENQEIFCKRFLIGELQSLEDVSVDALDSDKTANPFDKLRKPLILCSNSKDFLIYY